METVTSIDQNRSFRFSHSIMPADIRPLVMPSQLSLPHTNRYIPCFDSQKNKCWWEKYVSNQDNDGWETPKSGSGYHRRRKERMAKRHQDDDHIVGEELFIDEDEVNVDDQLSEEEKTIRQIETMAWNRFHEENARRQELADNWMRKRFK